MTESWLISSRRGNLRPSSLESASQETSSTIRRREVARQTIYKSYQSSSHSSKLSIRITLHVRLRLSTAARIAFMSSAIHHCQKWTTWNASAPWFAPPDNLSDKKAIRLSHQYGPIEKIQICQQCPPARDKKYYRGAIVVHESWLIDPLIRLVVARSKTPSRCRIYSTRCSSWPSCSRRTWLNRKIIVACLRHSKKFWLVHSSHEYPSKIITKLCLLLRGLHRR